MTKFKITKIILIYILTAIIILSTLTSVLIIDLQIKHNVFWSIVFFVICLFSIIMPMYYLISYVNKAEESLRNSVELISSEIRNMNDESHDKISVLKLYAPIADSIAEVNERNKNTERSNEIMTDILVCAVRNLELDKFIDNVMDKIMEIISSDWAAYYSLNKLTNKLEIKSSKGFSKNIYSQYDITIGEGYIGNAAARNQIKIINDLPDDTIFLVNTFLGEIKPKNLVVVPVCDENNDVLGVFAAASIYSYTSKQLDIIERIRKYISYAIANGNYYNKTLRVANELKFQNQLIQNLNDDLESRIKARTISLNNIINSIKDAAIISVDGGNLITTFSETAEKMFSVKADDVMGRNIRSVAENLPGFNSKLSELIENIEETKNASSVFDIETEGGKNFAVNLQLYAVYGELGKLVGVTIVIKDLSYINKIINTATADKKLNSILFENSTSALILTDREGYITSVNKNALYAFGFRMDEVVSHKISDFFAYQDRGLVEKYLEKAVSTKCESDFSAKLSKSGLNVTLLTNPITNDFTKEVKLLIIMH